VHLAEGLHGLEHAEVVSVVRVQDGLDADRPDLLLLLSRQPPEHITLGHLEDLEHRGAMHVLQGRLVVVADGEFVRGLHNEIVVQPRVADVVADAAHE